MQSNTISNLSISVKSIGRFHFEKKSKLRSPYQRDRDRILHSTAFRRLKHKTQVFVNTTGDHYRTRITHSLEVSQIAKDNFYTKSRPTIFTHHQSQILHEIA